MNEPTRSPDAIYDATCWARTWRRAEISIESADGQRDMQARCVALTREIAFRLRRFALGEPVALANASAIDVVADQMEALQVRAEEAGLEGRGA